MISQFFKRKIIAVIDNDEVKGQLIGEQDVEKDQLKLRGEFQFKNLKNTSVGMHVYDNGDISDNCTNLKGILMRKFYDTSRATYGNMGNLSIDENGVGKIDMFYPCFNLYGPSTILGLAFALHRDADGLDYENLATLPQAPKLGCGVFGIKFFEYVHTKTQFYRYEHKP